MVGRPLRLARLAPPPRPQIRGMAHFNPPHRPHHPPRRRARPAAVGARGGGLLQFTGPAPPRGSAPRAPRSEDVSSAFEASTVPTTTDGPLGTRPGHEHDGAPPPKPSPAPAASAS